MWTKTCRRCNETFTTREPKQLDCPTCIDIRRRYPTVVVARETTFDTTARLAFTPWWKEIKPTTRSTYIARQLGRAFGARWQGRIDMFSPDAPRSGDVVRLQERSAYHVTRVAYVTRSTVYGGSATFRHTERLNEDEHITRRYVAQAREVIARGWNVETFALPLADLGEEWNEDETIRTKRFIEVERRVSLYVEKTDADPEYVLVLARRIRKETLKGFGAQYHDTLSVSDAPIRAWRWRGEYRSARRDEEACLMVLPFHARVVAHRDYVSGSGKRKPFEIVYYDGSAQ